MATVGVKRIQKQREYIVQSILESDLQLSTKKIIDTVFLKIVFDTNRSEALQHG